MTRAATPADAKAVWDSIEATGKKPNLRGVAASLNASGQYLPVVYQTIQRWKKANWKAPAASTNLRKPKIEEAAAKVDVAVPILTGDSTTRVSDLVNDPSTLSLRDELIGLADDSLMKRAARETYITSILLMQRLQDRPELIEIFPREIGSLQEALAASIVAANGAFTTLLNLQERMLNMVPNQTEAPTEDVPLAVAIAAFKKATR